MKEITTNQSILNQLIDVANEVFTENEELFKPYGVAFTIQNIIKSIDVKYKHSYNKLYKYNTEIVINEGAFRCSFLRQDVFEVLQRFSGLPECKLDKNFMFTISDNYSRIEKIKTYEIDKKGNLKKKTILVEFLSDTFAFETGKGKYAKMYYIVGGIGYFQGENSKDIAEQRAKITGNNHDYAISSIKNMISKNEYFHKIIQLLALNLGFDASELDANNSKFNEEKEERTQLYNERMQEQQRIERENQERIEEKQKEIAQTKREFLDGKYITVDNFRGLCNELNIYIAPKTIGMLNKKISDISKNGIRYYSNCKRKPNADNLFYIIDILKDILLEQEHMEENPNIYMTDDEVKAFLYGTFVETFAPEQTWPKITVSDQTETLYPVIIPSCISTLSIVEQSDANITESVNIGTPIQIQLQQSQTNEWSVKI